MSFRIGDFEVFVGYEVAAALTAVLILDTDNRLVACFLAALLHELGHIFMMVACRVRVRALSLRLFDVLITADSPPTFCADVLITLAGAAANFLFALLFFAFLPVFSTANIALGIFNLLPVMSLDGGHLLYICIQRRFSMRACELVLRATTFVIMLPLMAAGIYFLFRSGYNYSLLAVSLYLLAVLFLK